MTPASLLTPLLRASLEGAVFVLLVGAVTRLAPRMPARARCALWWFASLRLLLGLFTLPVLRVPLPVLAAAPEPVLRAGGKAVMLAVPLATAIVPLGLDATNRALAVANGVDLARLLVIALFAIWLAGVVAVVLAHAREARRLTRLWREAAPIESSEVRAWFGAWVGAARARRVELRASAGLGSPLIMGGAHARIIVPSTCLDHDAASLRMALAHEMSHVRRGDLGWGLVPALAQCVFWFHPLAHWCVNEYAQTREEACDAEALRLSDATPHHYGELLVGFGVDSTRGAHAAASCGSSHVQQLKRRLRMLSLATRSTRTQRTLALGATLVIGLLSIVPVRLVAASVPASGVADPGTDDPIAPRVATRSTRATSSRTTTRATRSTTTKSRGSSFAYSTSDDASDDSFSYGYSHGDGQTMSGSFDTNDDAWLDRLRAQGRGDYAWFRFDRKTYLVKGADAIAQIKEAMRPEIELGEQQGRLGNEQARLGDEQSELGERQSELGDQQGELSAQLVKIESRLAESSRDDGQRATLERRRDEIHSRMEAISDKMSELGREQGRLGEKQSALGEKQSELGRRQNALSRQAREEMRQLGGQMVRDGRAVPLEP